MRIDAGDSPRTERQVAARRERGSTLLEVLIGSLFIAFAAVGVAYMYSYANTWAVGNGDDRIIIGLAQQKLEEVRNLGFG